MINLIIDAAKDKIFFKIIADDKSYTSEYINSRENFDKFVVLLFKFLEKNRINIKEINNIFINQGPGKFSSIRTSLAAAKGLSVSNQLNLYGFNSDQVNDQNYNEIIDLFNKGLLFSIQLTPYASSNLIIDLTSSSFGIFFKIKSLVLNKEETSIGREAFLEPETFIDPYNFALPFILILSIFFINFFSFLNI